MNSWGYSGAGSRSDSTSEAKSTALAKTPCASHRFPIGAAMPGTTQCVKDRALCLAAANALAARGVPHGGISPRGGSKTGHAFLGQNLS